MPPEIIYTPPTDTYSISLEINRNPVRQTRHALSNVPDDEELDFATLKTSIITSWVNSFDFQRENVEYGIEGLRPPQIGAVHAIEAHCIVSEEPATIVLPTGTGKTETMLSVLVARRCSSVLVIVPSEPLRTQIADKFITLGLLKRIGVVADNALYPIVGTLKHVPRDVAAIDELCGACQIIVATAQLLSMCSSEVQDALAAYTRYVFVDEAHHREAPSWSALLQKFNNSRILQFTATPFRNDGKLVTGKIVFNYSLKQAQRDGYFTHIDFVPVEVFHPDIEEADKAIARVAIEKLREDLRNGYDHILMARVNTVSRAKAVFELYREHEEFNPVQIHTGLSVTERRDIRRQIIEKQTRIIVCVDMLGEGFDLPELKIAAFHDTRQSVPVTLQLAGRFTRSRDDLGTATIVANTAYPPTNEALQKLYTQNPDWNSLLRVTAEDLIDSQLELREFIEGFPSLAEDIPLQTVRIKMSTAVYRTNCNEWTPRNFSNGIHKFDSYDLVKHEVNNERDTIIILTVRKVPFTWLPSDDYHSLEIALYVAFWDRTQSLLFINQSMKKGYPDALARALVGGTEKIKGLAVFRSLQGINRLTLRNVGLNVERGRRISYEMRAGSDIEPAIPQATRQRSSRNNVFGTGYENGSEVTAGCTIKGRIWSARDCNINEFVHWCSHIGRKLLDNTINAQAVLDGVLVAQSLQARPNLIPIAVDWHDDIFAKSERFTNIQSETYKKSLHHAELRVSSILATDEPLEFEVCCNDLVSKYVIHFENSTVRFERIDGALLHFEHGRNSRVRDIDFFNKYPPKFYFVDGSTLSGNEFIDLSTQTAPYDLRKIDSWDWTGVDIESESQRVEKNPTSVQYKVIQKLMEDDYTIIFDDDDSGEAADVVAIRNADSAIEVDLYHCKFSGREFAGRRVGDLYEVCGQAQKSIRWVSKPTRLFEHLLNRDPRTREGIDYSRFEKGDKTILSTIKNRSKMHPVVFRIFIVQPGLASNPSDEQLALLSVTENYLLDTYQLHFGVIGNVDRAP